MCLIVFAWDMHPKYKLILAANRDEFYERPTRSADYWQDHPNILGGRDLKAGGTWMSVSKQGKIAAVTNYRDPENIRAEVNSRGEIPVNYLKESLSAESYLEALHASSGDYNGFNVILGSLDNMAHYSNYERKLNIIDPGIHGLSNALLDTSWPKVDKAKARFAEITSNNFTHADLLEMMGDSELADDELLPETGVSRELERVLSAMCIRTEEYGTCSTTVITLDRDGAVAFTERTHAVGGRKAAEKSFGFQSE